MGWPTVNRDLFPMKAHYFLFNAGSGPIVPFLPTYAKQLGFSPLLVGTIYMVLPVFGMLAKPLFGAVADHFMRQKALFITFQILSALTLFAVQFTPEVPTQSIFQLHCHQETNLVACNPLDPKTADLVEIEALYNGTVLCDLQCTVSSDAMFKDICAHWHDLPQCSSVGEHPGKPTVELKSGEHMKTYEPSVSLSLTAEIAMKHYEKEGNCSFFRIQNAILPDKSPFHPYCSVQEDLNCTAKCNNPTVMELITRPIIDDANASHTHQFWLLFVMLIIAWSSMAVVASVSDAICFGILGDKPNHYGQQRLWGAVGWGLSSLIAGLLVDELSHGQMKKDYTVCFYLVIVNVALSVFVSFKLKDTQTQMSRNIFQDVGLLLSDIRIIIFMLWCVVVGIDTALVWQFLFWHLEKLTGLTQWSKLLQGLMSVVQCFGGELPFFFLSGRILKRLGHIHVMTLVLAAFSIRFFLYSLLTNPWWCLPIELFQGVTFGLFYATMASYASVVSPPGTEATVQGLVGAVFEGVGVALGSLIGGTIFHLYSGVVMFQVFAALSGLLAALHAGVQMHLSRSSSAPSADKGFKNARYAAPNEAIDMLDDQLVLTGS